jgi:hypothetical protein
MKDENDNVTMEINLATKPKRKRVPKLQERPLKQDAASSKAAETQKPDCVKVRSIGSVYAAHFVPVSFVAKDWGVTSRRIRALLSSGRLVGQLLGNGYWEVRYPYLYSEGMRGPVPKRHQRPSKQGLQMVVNNTERRAE